MQSRPHSLRVAVATLVLAASAAAATPQAGADPPGPDPRGVHAFDWEAGRWRTQLRRLAQPLSGSGEWLEYEGTSTVTPLLDGRANVVELRVEGPAGRIEGLALRLYEPQGGQWSLNYASVRNGKLTTPVVGGFREGRGEFHGIDEVDGRAVLVRFVITRPSADTARFEQAYSGDGGRSWETNWIAVDTRIAEE